MDGKSNYLPAVDGLRAIAVLAVVAYHAGLPVAGGFVGVDVFFVISGYLITRILRDELAETGQISFAGFYARRARRILPALLAVVAVSVPAAWFTLPDAEAAAAVQSGVAALAFMANIHFALQPGGYFDPAMETNPLLHLWSLGVEEQFYIAWPLLLVALRQRPALALWVVTVGSLAVSEHLLATGQGGHAFFQTPARAWQLAVGGLVALHRPHLPAWAGHLGIAVVLAACFVPVAHFPGLGALPATLGAAAVIAAAASGKRLPELEARPLVWIGLVSYSLYLWHWPILTLGSASPAWLLVLASGLVAWASYRFVEQPLRRMRMPNRTTLSGAILAIAAIGGSILLLPRPTSESPHRIDDMATLIPIYRMGCDGWIETAELNPCGFGPADAPHTAVLLGDSVVMQWFPAVRAIFDRPGWRLVVLTKSSCPMVDAPFYFERIGAVYAICAEWRAASLHWVAETAPDVVITGSANNYGFPRDIWVDGLSRTLEALSQSSGQVVHLRSTPLLNAGGHASYDGVFAWEAEVARGFANVRVADLNPVICPGQDCLGARNHYRDMRHLHPRYVLSLIDEFSQRTGLAKLPH